MGRAPCCDKAKVKRGPWSPDEDALLRGYVEKNGIVGNWISLPQKAGLNRCGKSCRLRWLNYLRPDIKHGGFTEEEDNIILTLYNNIGSRWSVIANHLHGRTDNDVKNYFNTKLKKRQMAATMASTFSELNFIQPASYPPLPFVKSEAGGYGNLPLPAPTQEASQYTQESQRLFWELFANYPPPGLFESPDARCSSGYYVSPAEGSAASSSATNVQNSSSGSYGNWAVNRPVVAADEWFMPELGFGLPEVLAGYQSHGDELAAQTSPRGFCHGVSYT